MKNYMKRSFFLAALLDGMAGIFRPRAPDMTDLPDTAEAILRELRLDYANEAKFPSRRRQLRAESRDAAGYIWERGTGWVKKKRR